MSSLEERTAAVTTREGRVQGLEGLKVQLDADKAALEQRRLQLDSAETEVCVHSNHSWPQPFPVNSQKY